MSTKRPDIPTCREPKDATKLYMRNLYHEFFWGPFASEDELSSAIAALDAWDSYWDYDPFCIIHGAYPLPDDFVFGFPAVTPEERTRILTKAGRDKKYA